MGFSTQWDLRYTQNNHMSIWPWTDLVSLVNRYALNQRSHDPRVLELGCGAGANIHFFISKGFDYYGIDGSPTIIAKLKETQPLKSEQLVIADFTQEIPGGELFDLIVDRAALTHNSAISIKRALDLVFQRLKPSGLFIGVDWFSNVHSEYENGLQAEDKWTKTEYKSGPFAGVGRVHFSDQQHMLDLFSRFEILLLQHKVLEDIIHPNKEKLEVATWNIVVKKV